jgi:ABC-2 type transport system permease protein
VHRMLAVARVYAKAMVTYRAQTLISVISVAISVIPVFFIARAVQAIAAPAIRAESPEYFTYLVLGAVGAFVVSEATAGLPGLVNNYINNGSLEQLLSTPLRWPQLLVGLSLYGYAWVALRALVLMTVAWVWATSTIMWTRVPELVLILGILAMVYTGAGLVAAALVLRTRSTLYVPQVVLATVTLFGTVWFPVGILPEVYRSFAAATPMTLGLRAARQVVLLDLPLSAVLPTIGTLSLWALGSLTVGAFVFDRALRAARRDGTLSQY